MKQLRRIGLISGLIIVLILGACGGVDTEVGPYEYTHTTKIKQLEIFDNERIKTTDRSLVMTLEQLGYDDLPIPVGEEEESPVIEYTLPEADPGGADRWYIFYFHFLIEFDETTGVGFGDVQASPLGSVQFETLIVNDSPYIRFVGNDPASSNSIRMDVRYYAYANEGVIVTGKNEITFELDQAQRAKVKSLTVFNDTGLEFTSVPPYEEVEPPPDAFEPFYGVSPELTAKLEQICLADARIQELLKDREYTFTADGHTIENKDYHLAVGVRLEDDITSEQFREWMDGGRQDSELIKEYVGVLDIGYSAKYDIVIDMENGTIAELTQREKTDSGIPELTPAEKQRAVEIALADATLRQILEGKEYEIAPQGTIGVWHDGEIKLGAAFEIRFAQTYQIEAELPRYGSEPYLYSGDVTRLMIGVLLDDNRVANIIPLNFSTAE